MPGNEQANVQDYIDTLRIRSGCKHILIACAPLRAKRA
jgi:hypothetical protein